MENRQRGQNKGMCCLYGFGNVYSGIGGYNDRKY